jgi:regulator of nucleoside diphosphate kinase
VRYINWNAFSTSQRQRAIFISRNPKAIEKGTIMKKKIWTTAKDKQRLEECLAILNDFPDKRELPHIRELQQELDRAQVVIDPIETPPDMITMRSRVRLLNLDTGKEVECTLVYPAESSAEEEKISVLAPLGTAMLGYRVNDEFEANLPKGRTSFRVEEILYQPEAAGDYHL